MEWLTAKFSGRARRTVVVRQLTDRIFPRLTQHLADDMRMWSDSRMSGYVRAKASLLIDESLDQICRIEPRLVARHREKLWNETLEMVTERVASRLTPVAPRIYRPAQAA